MSDEKIDVLDDMELAANNMDSMCIDLYGMVCEYGDDMRKARAAVAELIEAAKAATAQVLHNGTSSREACERLDAAWRACVAANA